jgi:hypothetical protein
MVSSQLVLEFVNTALYGSSAVIVAPDFQGRIAAIGDKDPDGQNRKRVPQAMRLK